MKKIILHLILVMCVAGFTYSGYTLFCIKRQYRKMDRDNKKLIEEVIADPEADYLSRKIDFPTLKSINEDIKGWLYIPDTGIDYPLLKGKSNQTYLRHNYLHQKATAGCLFIEEDCTADFSDDNTIIYGHNMHDGTMFAPLKSYPNKAYFTAHPYAYIYLPDGHVRTYELFSVNIISATSDLYSPTIDYRNYLAQVIRTSSYHIDVNDEKKAHLIMLSTCYAHNSPSRYVVWGRQVKNETVKEV